MGDLVNLSERRPHLSGKAHCLDCGHGWVAVCAVGTVWLECPECGGGKGVMRYPVLRDGVCWVCACGCDIFTITPDATYCVMCGAAQSF